MELNWNGCFPGNWLLVVLYIPEAALMCDWGHCPVEMPSWVQVSNGSLRLSWGSLPPSLLWVQCSWSSLFRLQNKVASQVWLIWPLNFQKLSVLENRRLSWTTAYQSMVMWSFLTPDSDIDVSLMSWRIFFWPSEPTHLSVIASLSFRPKLNGYPPQQLVSLWYFNLMFCKH